MQLFEEKTTKRHARLVGLSAILAATQVFQIEITKIPILGIEGVNLNTAPIVISLLVVIWFVTWAQLYWFDDLIKLSNIKFSNKVKFSELYFQDTNDFDNFSKQNGSIENEYAVHLKDGKLPDLDIVDNFMEFREQIYERLVKCNQEYKSKWWVFHLTKVAFGILCQFVYFNNKQGLTYNDRQGFQL